MTCCSSSGSMPNQQALKQRLDHERLLAASHDLGEGVLQTDLVVPSMHCAACIRTIETGLGAIQGVDNARANLSTRRVSVRWRPEAAGDADFVAALGRLGFEAGLFDHAGLAHDGDETGRKLLVCLAVAGFAAANVMLLSVSVWAGAEAETQRLFQLISGLIAVPASVFAGQPFYHSAWAALKNHRLNMDVPISLAVMLSLGVSIYEALYGQHETWFEASVTLLFFLLIGRYLDHMMRERARSAILQLSRLMPSGASRIARNGEANYTPLAELKAGDRILVSAGERVPVDARILSGLSDLDRSLVNGESAAVQAAPGLEVESGVLNLTGPLTLEVMRPADRSFVASVITLMEAASQSNSRHVRLADRIAAMYSPVVHLLAGLSFMGWIVWTGGDWYTSLNIAIAVLIITCPCALALAVPIAQVVAANRLFRSGVMVKDGAALEHLAEADTVVFDKTGTLTLGEPRIAAIHGGSDQEHAVAAVLARLSTHPAARAAAAANPSAQGILVSDVEELAGLGLEATWKGRKVRLGRRAWVAGIARTGTGQIEHPAPSSSEVCFAVAGGDIVSFQLSDTLRSDAATVVRNLRQRGLALEILSGDTPGPVGAVAAQLGIEKAADSLKPAEKTARVEELRAAGHRVLYVGDGLNDAPALAAADVSMAPASGSDIGRASAGLVFTGKGLAAIPVAIQVARSTGRIVRQNFALALGYNAIAVPLAVFGQVTPLVAALAMSSSSILVVANSLRLNLVARTDRVKPATGQRQDAAANSDAAGDGQPTAPASGRPRLEAVK